MVLRNTTDPSGRADGSEIWKTPKGRIWSLSPNRPSNDGHLCPPLCRSDEAQIRIFIELPTRPIALFTVLLMGDQVRLADPAK